MIIESSSNPRIKKISALTKKSRLRKETGFFIAEGPRMVFETPGELLQEIYVSQSFLEDERFLDYCRRQGLSLEDEKPGTTPVSVVSDGVMKSLSDTVTPQGILAVVKSPSYEMDELLGDSAFVVALDRLQDPGNMGTIFRTGEGAGVTGIIMSRDCVDIFSPKVVRSTMGSLYRVPFYVSEDLPRDIGILKSKGVSFLAAHPEGSDIYYEADMRVPTGILIGNEGSGLSPEVSAMADKRITIPMKGQVESLNAAMACGILLYEGTRQRR